jgi:phosphoribosylformylglycinamidine synthase
MIGNTKDELGGSEYSEYIHKFIGGKCPTVDFSDSKKNMYAVLKIIENNLIKSAHDCSKGGLAIAISELCMINLIGCNVSLENIPGDKLDNDTILFSESHSRYLITFEKKNLQNLEELLKKHNVSFKTIGEFGGESIQFTTDSKPIIDLSVDKAQKTWLNSLKEMVMHA